MLLRLVTPVTLLAAAAIAMEPCDFPDDPPPTPVPPGQCMVTGCSGQICAPEPVDTTCEWTCEYGCYKHALCEPQASGACGWTPTADYDACLDSCQSWDY